MAKLSKKSRYPKAAAAARDSRGAAMQAGGSAVAVITAADQPALGRAYRASKNSRFDGRRRSSPDTREPRDRPACWLRPVADRLDQPSDHRRAYDDDGGQVSGADGTLGLTDELDHSHGFMQAEIPAPAPRPQLTDRRAGRSMGNFQPRNSLKSLKTEKG